MSWQERIERYLAEQKRQEEGVQAKAEREKREDLEAKLGIVKEKVPPLLDVLEQYDCKNLLTGIRNEVWRIGEVSVQPDVTNLSPETPIVASAALQVYWPVYVKDSSGWSSPGENAHWEDRPSGIGGGGKRLVINAVYGKISGLDVVYDSSFRDILLLIEKGFWRIKFPTAESGERPYCKLSSTGPFEPFEIIEMTSTEEVAKSLESVLVRYSAYSGDLRGAKEEAAMEILRQARTDLEFRRQHVEELKEIAKENGLPLSF